MSALVDVKVNSVVSVNIEGEEAFRILCKVLQMECVFDENTKFVVRRNLCGTNGVYCMSGNQERLYDSRGDLFVALRNVAVQLFPNVGFRNESYIYDNHYKNVEVNYESEVVD